MMIFKVFSNSNHAGVVHLSPCAAPSPEQEQLWLSLLPSSTGPVVPLDCSQGCGDSGLSRAARACTGTITQSHSGRDAAPKVTGAAAVGAQHTQLSLLPLPCRACQWLLSPDWALLGFAELGGCPARAKIPPGWGVRDGKEDWRTVGALPCAPCPPEPFLGCTPAFTSAGISQL